MNDDINKIAPQQLLETFSKGKVAQSLLWAIVLHIVIIGGLSTTYIYYTWINPDAGKAREEAEAKEREEKEASEQTATAKEVAEKPAPEHKKTAKKTEEQLLEEHKDAPIVKKITEKASPEEIPDVPNGLGISLEDTNP